MFNLAIGMTGIVLCLLGLLQIRIGAVLDRRTERYFRLSYLCLLLFAGSNLAGQLMRGLPGAGYRIGLEIANFGEFFFSCLLVYIVSLYLLSLVGGERKEIRAALTVLMLAHVALLVVSQFTGILYSIDAENLYHRGVWYPLSALFPGIMLILDIGILIRERDKLTHRERIALWSYFLLPGVAIVVQLFVYGVYFIVFATIIGAFVLFLFIASDQTERYYRQREENARLKIDILLAQIQPHFLFNSLTLIKSACRTDPEKAEKAIDRFTEYLRHNMDSLSIDSPIPFVQELEHVRRYLELQQLRFREDLNVVYDLECTEFAIPTLTLQPLVENAVTYGIRRSETGTGTVAVRTREYPDRYEVSVIDTGPGFVVEKIPGDKERSHTGIRNVRERLRHICGGELQIDSAVGSGTTATIRLPRAGQALPGS